MTLLHHEDPAGTLFESCHHLTLKGACSFGVSPAIYSSHTYSFTMSQPPLPLAFIQNDAQCPSDGWLRNPAWIGNIFIVSVTVIEI